MRKLLRIFVVGAALHVSHQSSELTPALGYHSIFAALMACGRAPSLSRLSHKS